MRMYIYIFFLIHIFIDKKDRKKYSKKKTVLDSFIFEACERNIRIISGLNFNIFINCFKLYLTKFERNKINTVMAFLCTLF